MLHDSKPGTEGFVDTELVLVSGITEDGVAEAVRRAAARAGHRSAGTTT